MSLYLLAGAIGELFERMERQHGQILVNHTLAYITAAKNGLTESELEDILSCDDEVLEDVYQYWVTKVLLIKASVYLNVSALLALDAVYQEK